VSGSEFFKKPQLILAALAAVNYHHAGASRAEANMTRQGHRGIPWVAANHGIPRHPIDHHDPGRGRSTMSLCASYA